MTAPESLKSQQLVPDTPQVNPGAQVCFLGLTAQIVTAFLKQGGIHAGKVSELINITHASLLNVTQEASLRALHASSDAGPDMLICLEDGKRMKMLKRYLKRVYNLSPDEYRAKWGLPKDAPMTAPSSRKLRQDLAKKPRRPRSGRANVG